MPAVRVLHVLPCDVLAGTELMVASLIIRSDQTCVTHELATLAPPGPIVARLAAEGRWTASLGGSGGLPGATRRLGRLLRARPYEVVNAYGLVASVVTRLLVRALQPDAVFVCGVRALHVTEVERLDSPKARLASVVERSFGSLVDVYDANSRAALDRLARLGVARDRLVHIPNGLDLAAWTPDGRAAGDEAEPLILCTARFVERKRHADLLEALAALRRDGHRFRAVLAGDGPTLEAMRARAAGLGLDGAVEFPGTLGRDEVVRLLRTAAVACLPSAWEGMPGALMEAMASGVAVVGTDVSGTDELVEDGESGLLVPPYDPPALAGALGRLLRDRALRERLAAGGRRRMEQCFSLEGMLGAKQQLYVQLAHSGRRRRYR